VPVFVVARTGDEEPWFLVTSAVDLSAAQVVEVFTARFRPEDAFRDHQQRLGMEECRAWTKEPIPHTFQVHLVALTLLRLLHARVDQAWGRGRGGSSRSGLLGRTMPQSSTCVVCSGGTAPSFRQTWSIWKNWKQSRRPLADAGTRPGKLLKFLETTELDFGHSGIEPFRTRQGRAGVGRKRGEV
jgi:hypothetical protein